MTSQTSTLSTFSCFVFRRGFFGHFVIVFLTTADRNINLRGTQVTSFFFHYQVHHNLNMNRSGGGRSYLECPKAFGASSFMVLYVHRNHTTHGGRRGRLDGAGNESLGPPPCSHNSWALRRCGAGELWYKYPVPYFPKRLWFVDTVLWLCPSLPTETLKWLSSLPILTQESFWWGQCSHRYKYNLPLPPPPYPFPPPPPFSPSLISLMVSVDVKHHVYLLTYFPRPCEPVWPSGKALGW